MVGRPMKLLTKRVNEAVSGVTTICLPQGNTLPPLKVNQVINWQSCWILGTRTHIIYAKYRAFQTCSMSDMFSKHTSHAKTGVFLVSRNCVQILRTWGHAGDGSGWTGWHWPQISLPYLWEFKLPLIKCTWTPYPSHMRAHTISPIGPQRRHQQTAHTHTAYALCSKNQYSSVERIPLHTLSTVSFWPLKLLCAEIVWLSKSIVAAAVRWLFWDNLEG